MGSTEGLPYRGLYMSLRVQSVLLSHYTLMRWKTWVWESDGAGCKCWLCHFLSDLGKLCDLLSLNFLSVPLGGKKPSAFRAAARIKGTNSAQ